MTQCQNTRSWFLSTRNRMRDFRVDVGNLIKIISKPTFFCFQMKTFTSDALYKITTHTNKEYTCNLNMYQLILLKLQVARYFLQSSFHFDQNMAIILVVVRLANGCRKLSFVFKRRLLPTPHNYEIIICDKQTMYIALST